MTQRIHGAAIYGNMDPINIPPLMLAYPMDPSTFLGSVWGIIYYNLEG